MKTELTESIKVKIEKNDVPYSSNSHLCVKSETKVNLNNSSLDLKPNIKTSNDLDSGVGTSESKVAVKVRRKVRKVSTRKSSSTKVRRRTKVRRKRRTTTRRTKGSSAKGTKGRRKRTRKSKPLVTGKALTPRARLCKKLGIERNLSLGAHSLPTIKKMTQENINHKRAAAGIGVLSIFGSELNSHGSVPLRADRPDLEPELSGIDDNSPLADEQDDSFGPPLPLEENALDDDNINPDIINNPVNNNNTDQIDQKPISSCSDSEVKLNIKAPEVMDIDIKPVLTVLPEAQSDQKPPDPPPVSEPAPVPVPVPISVLEKETPREKEKPKEKKRVDIEDGEIAEPGSEIKSNVKRCKHGKLIHVKKHSDSCKFKSDASKEGKKQESKSSSSSSTTATATLIKTIKKEPRDRDDDKLIDNMKDARDRGRSSIPNRHDVDFTSRRYTRSPHHEEKSSKHRENDRNRENHQRDERIRDKRRRRSLSRSPPAPLMPPQLPLPPPPTSSSNRSRAQENSSKLHRSKRDSSRSNRSPIRKEPRRTSLTRHESHESSITKKKGYDSDVGGKGGGEERSKPKKKKRKHKHKHSKYEEDSDYDTKSGKNYDSIDSKEHLKRLVATNSGDKMDSSINHDRHHDHHHKKNKRHHSREGRSSPSVHHKISPHREEPRDIKPNLSRSRPKRSRHSSSDRETHSNRTNRNDRRESSAYSKNVKNLHASDQVDAANLKEVKVKSEDDRKDHPPINSSSVNPSNNETSGYKTVNSKDSKLLRSPSEGKSISCKPGSPPKKDVRLVSKSRTEFDIFWDENSQNKKMDVNNTHPEYGPTGDEPNNNVKEKSGLRFLPRTLLSDQPLPNVHLPSSTAGPRTPPDDERTGKTVLFSPDQTMPTPTQDESLEANSDVQSIKSEINRSKAKLNELEKKSSPAEKQISPVKNVPRPGTPDFPSPCSPHNQQHKFKSPNSLNSVIGNPPQSTNSTSNISRVPTLAESSLPPAPGSLLAQIQQTLNLQTKNHSSHSDSKQTQSHPSHSVSTGLSSSSSQSTSVHATSSSGNDQQIKSSSAPHINALSPSLKSLLENLIKAAEQQQTKLSGKTSASSSSATSNNIFKKPAVVLDSKSRSTSHSASSSHHHSVKAKVIDKEGTKKSLNQGPGSGPVSASIAPSSGSAPGPGMKIADVATLDDVPSSAVELQVKEKYLKKLNRQERVVEEVKMVLKPFYQRKDITKDEYKEILRKAVPKICHSKSGEINPQKIRLLVEGYCNRFKHGRKKNKTAGKGN